MSARFSRNAFTAAARRAQAYGVSTATRVSRRAMSSTSHGAGVKSSDTPWIAGSLLVFGPAFLYLVSPSARKNSNVHIHDDKHDYPTLKHVGHDAEPAKEKAPEVMEDSEGTPADVGGSIAKAEESDVPSASVPLQAEPEEGIADASESKESPEQVNGQKSGTFQEEGEEGPTDLSKAQEAAQSGTTPKEVSESKN